MAGGHFKTTDTETALTTESDLGYPLVASVSGSNTRGQIRMVPRSGDPSAPQTGDLTHDGTNFKHYSGTSFKTLVDSRSTLNSKVYGFSDMVVGPVAPTSYNEGMFSVWEFGEDTATLLFPFIVPSNWDPNTDIQLKVYWTNEADYALSQGDTFTWGVSYRVIDTAAHELWDNGTEATASTLYTCPSWTNHQTQETVITIPRVHATQALVAGNTIAFKFNLPAHSSAVAADVFAVAVLYYTLGPSQGQ